MIISYQWLLEYLPEPLPVNELSKILTSIGLEVEAVEPVGGIPGGLEGLVIGEVLTCGRHPNADKLSVTTVSLGGPIVLLTQAPKNEQRDWEPELLENAEDELDHCWASFSRAGTKRSGLNHTSKNLTRQLHLRISTK